VVHQGVGVHFQATQEGQQTGGQQQQRTRGVWPCKLQCSSTNRCGMSRLGSRQVAPYALCLALQGSTGLYFSAFPAGSGYQLYLLIDSLSPWALPCKGADSVLSNQTYDFKCRLA
jgi:hypothetical protein